MTHLAHRGAEAAKEGLRDRAAKGHAHPVDRGEERAEGGLVGARRNLRDDEIGDKLLRHHREHHMWRGHQTGDVDGEITGDAGRLLEMW